MNWFIPALLACLCWGVGQTLVKRGLSSVSPLVSDIFFVVSALIIIIPYTFFNGLTMAHMPLVLIFGLLAALPNLMLPYILEKGNVSLSGTVLATYPIITVMLSILFLHERLQTLGWIGVLFAILGTFLIGKPKNFRVKLEPWLAWGITGCLVMGIGDFIGKIGVSKFSLYSFLFAFAIGNVISLGVVAVIDKNKKSIKHISLDVLIGFIGNFLMQLGLVFFYIAMNYGQASQVSPIASVYPIITAVLAYLWLKEKITMTQCMGILAATMGVILLGI